jgi:hypothetical protein
VGVEVLGMAFDGIFIGFSATSEDGLEVREDGESESGPNHGAVVP